MVESSLHVGVSDYIITFQDKRKTVIAIGYVNPFFGRLNQDITCFHGLVYIAVKSETRLQVV